MKKIFILLVFALTAISYAEAQTCVPDTLCITGVARDLNNVPVADSLIDVQIEISQGSPLPNGSNIQYCELLTNISTNIYGEFTACFGAPSFLCSPFNPFDQVQWEKCDLYYRLGWRVTGQPTIQVIATSRFGSVPFAFVARSAEQLTGSNGASDGQVLQWDSTQQQWLPTTISTGGTTLLAGQGIYIAGNNPYTIVNTGDNDSSPSNEFQSLSLTGQNLTISSGNSINLTSFLDNTDNQSLALSGTTLNISGGNGVNLSSINTDNQTLSLSGLNLSIAGGNSVALNVNDADASPTNEIQALSLAGNSLSLSLGGGSVTLPGGSSQWLTNGNKIYYNSGNVGVGVSNPANKFEVSGIINPVDNTIAAITASGGTVDDGAFVKIGTNDYRGALRLGGTQFTAPTNEARLFHTTGGWQWSQELNVKKFLAIEGTQNPSVVFQSPSSGPIWDIGMNNAGTWPNHFWIGDGGNSVFTITRSNGFVGIGTSPPTAKSKLHVHDGDVYLDNAANGVILTSPNGACWRATVSNAGAWALASITCP